MLSPRLMLILAQALLVVGSISLIPASVRLFSRAIDAGMPVWNLYWIVPVAMVLGGAKAVFVMRKRMRQNIDRLRSAEGKLWPWQIYPPQLLAFILSMVVMMFVMKRVLAGNAVGLGALGAVDVAVAVALVVASGEYHRKKS
jgi:hypothetical protein